MRFGHLNASSGISRQAGITTQTNTSYTESLLSAA
jgi:hypothetical protein